MLSPLASFLRLASVLLCLIVGVSFLLFVINRTSSASAHQQSELNGEIPPPAESPYTGPGVQSPGASAPARSGQTHKSKGSVRKTIDEVAHAVESPFTGLTDGWSSEWLRRGVLLLLSLAVYGFGLGLLARTLRVRA